MITKPQRTAEPLFSRRTTGKRLHGSALQRALAHQVLDRAKAGHEVGAAEVVQALRATGDLVDASKVA